MTQFPSLFQNVLAEQNPSSLQAQQQQQPPPSCNQPSQTKSFGPFPQQNFPAGNLSAPQQQQHQQQQYPGQQTGPYWSQLSGNNPYYCNGWQQPNPTTQTATCAPLLPTSLLEQIRACAQQSASPIFILPGAPANSTSSMPSCQPVISPTCIPYPLPMPVYPPYDHKAAENKCKCPSNDNRDYWSLNNVNQWEQNFAGTQQCKSQQENAGPRQHQCKESSDGAICSQKNCPASIQLQAMISQLLGVQGVIPAAITRILLRSVAGSNVNESIEDVMARATRCIRQMSKDDLLRESKASREVHGLLGLFLSSLSTLPRLIPVLTQAQLKSNLLKALLEGLVNAKLMESQGGAEPPDQLDGLLLELKPDQELRQLLSKLREGECEERVNQAFAAGDAQRAIAESRLANLRRKIQQVEREIQRRRDGQGQCEDVNGLASALQRHSASVGLPGSYDSPDPFVAMRPRSPRRLLLRPHVGSPETSYRSRPVPDAAAAAKSPFCVKSCADQTPRQEATESSVLKEKCEVLPIKTEENLVNYHVDHPKKTNKSECNCQMLSDEDETLLHNNTISDFEIKPKITDLNKIKKKYNSEANIENEDFHITKVKKENNNDEKIETNNFDHTLIQEELFDKSDSENTCIKEYNDLDHELK